MTSVNHTNTRFRGITHCPCSGCENGVNKSELSFDIWWLYLNGTTPQLGKREIPQLEAVAMCTTQKEWTGEKKKNNSKY